VNGDDELVQIRLPPRDGEPVLSRRSFLELLGAGVALAGLDGCGRDVPEKILPYSVRPRDVTPGVASYYATSMLRDGFATGLVVESHEGRPTKIEGNPEHPASLGGTGLHEQASVLSVYDPDRAGRVRHKSEPSSWEALAEWLIQPREDRGARLRLLLEPTTSPTVHALLARVRARHPRMKVSFFAPLPAIAHTTAGALVALGRPLVPQYDLRAADVIVALDADLFGAMPFSLRYARQWSSRRRPAGARAAMNRLYAVECMPSTTGMAADHRLERRSGEIAAITAALAAALPGIAGELRAALLRSASALSVARALEGEAERFVSAMARDLARRPRGSTLVVVGERQPAAVHALGLAINAALGNFGATVGFTAPPLPLDGDQDLGGLTTELRAGAVETLVILDGNPAYGAPADLEFAQALPRAPERVYLGAYENETARACNWFAPGAHYLESWGDGLAYDGTLSIVQPLVRPLRGGKTPQELLAMLAGEHAPNGHALVRATHAGKLDWDAALVRGFVPGTALPPAAFTAPAEAATLARAIAALPPAAGDALEINFLASPTLDDGRYSNNAWLLEQPEPATKLTWDNAVIISPATAARLGLVTEQLVELRAGERAVRGPIFVQPGHADEACSVWLGFGREGAESLARGRGFDVNPLRTVREPAFAAVELIKVPGTHELATTQLHHELHGRPIALATTLAEYLRDPRFTAAFKGPEPSLMAPYPFKGLQWAMSIDLSICTGCSACMLACQSENNLPVVGKTNVLKHREMHWLRIDSYFHGGGAAGGPAFVHQPMMCQHCETAPCEYVCPVNATVHSSDGLNEMVYNRCVGTRFCSNNCPYKVRRFNWFNWNTREPANQGTYELVHNPDVTVRDRGVMEKCTYCVQRIRETEIRARLEARELRPGEIVTACQQACPTGAIQFGSLSHKDTPMAAWREEARSYAVLNQEGTRPRTMYLARIDNPNPELAR
jgi:Fe-S-cluster-containing dehydrogenase component